MEEFERNVGQEITTAQVTNPDGSILKTIIEYKYNDKGQPVKVTKKIKLYKNKVQVNKKVDERRKWKKFGECAGVKGPEPGITNIAEECFIDMILPAGEQQDSKSNKKDQNISIGIVCRNCGKDHWTLKCPYFKGSQLQGSMPPSDTMESSSSSKSGGGEGKYVPPGKNRPIGASGSGSSSMGEKSDRDETATVRVTNLSEDTKETDLNELFHRFGPIRRIYLAKDKTTGLSKGFAFINFVFTEDAAKAIEKLSGKFGYDHLILHLEWAKPSNK